MGRAVAFGTYFTAGGESGDYSLHPPSGGASDDVTGDKTASVKDNESGGRTTAPVVFRPSIMKLRDHSIADQSHVVLEGLGHEVVGLHIAVENKLASIADPDISWRMESGDTGFFHAVLGKRRDLLVIQNKHFPEYAVLIAARPHGTVLHVSWMVLVQPLLRKDVRRALRLDVEAGTRFQVGSELDAIDVMDLRAFLGITRLVLKHAIRELTGREPEEDSGKTFDDGQ